MNLWMYEWVKNVCINMYAKDKIELIDFNEIMYRKAHWQQFKSSAGTNP